MKISIGKLVFLMAILTTESTFCRAADRNELHESAERINLSYLSSTTAFSNQFEVTAIKPTSRFCTLKLCDSEYQITIRNNGAAEKNVVVSLIAAPAGISINENEVVAGNIDGGSTLTPIDTIHLSGRQPNKNDFSSFVWSFTKISTNRLETVKPAEIVVLSLADIGFSNGVDSVAVRGAINKAIIKDGTLRFSTPSDNGSKQYAEFTFTKNSLNTILSIEIDTDRPVAPSSISEVKEDGSVGAETSSISIFGLDPYNNFSGNPIVFKISGTTALDLVKDSDGTVRGENNTFVSLKDYWVFDQSNASFTISGTKLTQLMQILPVGALDVSLNFVSADGEFAVAYDMLAKHGGAIINGALVTAQDQPVPSLAGKRVFLHGFNNNMRVAADIGINGEFTFSNIIPDTYELTLDDLKNPNVVSATTVILPDTTTADVVIVYNLEKNSLNSARSPQAKSFIGSRTRQNGTRIERSTSQKNRRNSFDPKATNPKLRGTIFEATSDGENATVTTPISFNVPQGTKKVGVKIVVSTEEYSEYTTQHSQYNDTWSYSIIGLPGKVLSASGSVNTSHYTQGSVASSDCIDVTAKAENSSFTVGGQVSATNIGDDVLTTASVVELDLTCGTLKVTAAKFFSPNINGNQVIQPVSAQQNLVGPYLSIPLTGTAGTHTLPLEISFTPEDAKISEVNISISDSNIAFSVENIISQEHITSKGKIKFSGISLPMFPNANTPGKVAVHVRIRGTVEEVDAVSDPEEGGQVLFRGVGSFTPLYLAGNEIGLGSRRYGARDVGGDSWATRQTIDWLQSRTYRFDDTSGQHIAQNSAGRSILGHAGHSDGQQIDMRYADGQGGFGESLGGANEGAGILQMINAARQEVVNNVNPRPRLAVLSAWITANRNQLTSEAADSRTRRIFVGMSFIKLALIDGRFPGSPTIPIPGIAPWNKPAAISIADGHLNHWHLSTAAHP